MADRFQEREDELKNQEEQELNRKAEDRPIADFFTGLGAGIRGGDPTRAIESNRAARSSKFQQLRKDRLDLIKKQREQIGKEREALQSDPESDMSVKARSMATDLALKANEGLKLGLDNETIKAFFKDKSAKDIADMDTLDSLKELKSFDTIRRKEIADAEKRALDTRRVGVDEGKLQLERDKFEAEQAKPEEEKPTKGEEQRDKEFAKEFVAFKDKGGEAEAQRDIATLSDALKQIREGGVSGAVEGRLPFQSITNPKGVRVQEAIAQVVQKTLRQTLGGQFSEKEGENLIKRAFNPKLDEAENAKRVQRLLNVTQQMLEAKQAAADHFAEKGTLRGFKSPKITLEDIEKGVFGGGPVKEDGSPITEKDIDNMSEEELRAAGLL